ncbi:MAG: nickel-dependent hydrogenase large subunit [Candidatus Eisenbacteria bacterium]
MATKNKTQIIPIGPYHPLQEEPEFFKLHVEGEKVVKLEIEIGYNHRGIEKLAEGLTYDQIPFLVERICGICSSSHPFACVNAIEDVANVDVPERVKYIRSFIGELERIHSHLLWLGLAGHFLGYNTVWMWAWKYREPVLDLFELITGNRNHYAMFKPGGVRRDIADEDIPTAMRLLDGLMKPLIMFRDIALSDPVLQARTVGVGVLTKEDCVELGALGPTSRASDVPWDVRRDHPYAAYGLVDWDVVVTKNGDVFDKVVVRVLEMVECIKICKQCLEKLREVRDGIDAELKEIPPGEGVGHHEAPRGEVFHYTRSDGTNRPIRYKVRAPSFMNVPTNNRAVIGYTVSDATITLAAIDPCYCCTERALVVDANSGKQVMGWKDLLRLSQEKTHRLMEKYNSRMDRIWI